MIDQFLYDQAAKFIDHPWLLNKTVPVIIAVGRFAKVKQFDLLIRAFATVLNHIHCRLIILGKGSLRGDLNNSIPDGLLGKLVGIDDQNGLADAMIATLKNPMNSAILQSGVEQFMVSRCVDKYIDAIRYFENVYYGYSQYESIMPNETTPKCVVAGN